MHIGDTTHDSREDLDRALIRLKHLRRQREITRQQVLCKIYDARHRAHEASKACSKARTGEEYENALREGLKAVQDFETWNKVLPSL